ncbi:helix-turn-helix domain-containing protein [Leptobacterium flavescens]|uniref:Helix-turn-helix domain-containing protein n=1 Tax=Leptobacterium flavescens TaxID=472055 RepID=A0A6P0UKX1_9FLAO|nr:helix-turn-helix domain-containing protein [Leptobacterium flavescens]NER13617.1 helix-turn-helix domain-containing protein [Leptobacterium flavescens]
MIYLLQKTPLSGQTILLFCGLLGIVWAYFLLVNKRGNLSANKYLALLIAVLAVLVLRQSVYSETFPRLQPFLYFISQGVLYLIGPAVYLHIKNLTGQKTPFSRVWKHFLPAVLTTLFMLGLFFYRTEIKEVNNILLLKIFFVTFVCLQLIHLLSYLIYSKKLIARYEKGLKRYYSSQTRINLKWMKQLLWICSSFAALIIAMYLLIVSGGYYEINNTADFLFLSLTAVLILSIIIRMWKQPEIVSGIYEEEQKYKTSPLSDSASGELKEKLQRLIREEKIYLDPELNLHQLASGMDTQPYIVSQLINQEYQQNFFNFINGHRIDFALEKIRNGYLKNTTLTGLAYDSGFNSKSTFNRAFKKKMQCSPKEYHNSVLKKPE